LSRDILFNFNINVNDRMTNMSMGMTSYLEGRKTPVACRRSLRGGPGGILVVLVILIV